MKRILKMAAVVLLSLALCVSLFLNFWQHMLYEDMECEYQKVEAAFFPAATSKASIEGACGWVP